MARFLIEFFSFLVVSDLYSDDDKYNLMALKSSESSGSSVSASGSTSSMLSGVDVTGDAGVRSDVTTDGLDTIVV